MKKVPQSPADKLAFQPQTLRRLSSGLTPEELQDVKGGQPPSNSGKSNPTAGC